MLAQNSFNKGLNMDVDNYIANNTIYIDGLNCTITTENNNEFIIQSAKGNRTTPRFALKPNYFAIGIGTYNNIAYIVSYNPKIRYTEIGSFPSPDPASDNLTYEYRAFQNYFSGLGNGPYSDFNTPYLPYSLDTPLEVHIQPSYDKSDNVILIAEGTSPRIINSRFIRLPGDKYKIAERLGKDSNLYNRNSFDSNIFLFPRSATITKLRFEGLFDKGTVPSGTYQYYFKLETQDGNQTEVINESLPVLVYSGNTRRQIEGEVSGNNIFNKADKSVRFTLSNLDQSFNKVRVYYRYTSGDKSGNFVEQIYRIENDYIINNSTLIFEHTNYEETTIVTEEELNTSFSEYDSVKTGVQLKGRLFLANTKTEFNSYYNLAEFAKNIKTRFERRSIDLTNTNINDSFKAQLSYTKTGDSWNLGYYNPFNNYYRVGYHLGETYAFGVVYILNNGTKTSVFPVRGINDYYNDGTYSNSNLKLDEIDLTTQNSNDINGENTLGLYRFPKFNNSLIANQTTGYIYGIKFDIPDFNTDIRTPEQILNNETPIYLKDLVKGFYFVRTDRKENLLSQGIITPTLKVSTLVDVKPDGHNEPFHVDTTFWSNKENYKNVPFPIGYLEGCDLIGKKVHHSYLYFIKEVNNTTSLFYDNITNRLKYAYYSSDLVTNIEQFEGILDGQSIYVDFLGYSNPRLSGFTKSKNRSLKAHTLIGSYQSFIDTSIFSNKGSAGRSEFAHGHQNIYTVDRFGASNTSSKFYTNLSQPVWARLNYDSYTGISLNTALTLEEHKRLFIDTLSKVNTTDPTPTKVGSGNYSNSPGGVLTPDWRPFQDLEALNENFSNFGFGSLRYNQEVNYGAQQYLGYIVNIYNNNIWDFNQAYIKYNNAVNEDYFRITETFSLNDLETVDPIEYNIPVKKEGSLQITAFTGDAYLGFSYKKYFTSSVGYENNEDLSYDVDAAQIIEVLTYSKSNPHFRTSEVVNTVEPLPRLALPLLENLNYTVIRNPEYRGLDSAQYNSGYNKFDSSINNFRLNFSNPTIDVSTNTRVAFTDVYTNSMFKNGYRFVTFSNYQDYDKQYGEIVKIVSHANKLIVVQEYSVFVAQVSERIQTASDTGGEIFLESLQVLPPMQYIGYLSTTYGSKHQFSVVNSDKAVYGVDIPQSKIWKVTERGMELISDFAVQSYITRLRSIYINSPSIIKEDVRTYYDVDKQDIIFNAYKAALKVPEISPEVTYNNVDIYNVDIKPNFTTDLSGNRTNVVNSISFNTKLDSTPTSIIFYGAGIDDKETQSKLAPIQHTSFNTWNIPFNDFKYDSTDTVYFTFIGKIIYPIFTINYKLINDNLNQNWLAPLPGYLSLRDLNLDLSTGMLSFYSVIYKSNNPISTDAYIYLTLTTPTITHNFAITIESNSNVDEVVYHTYSITEQGIHKLNFQLLSGSSTSEIEAYFSTDILVSDKNDLFPQVTDFSSITFNEKLNIWVTRNSYKSYMWFNVLRNYYTFPIEVNYNLFWWHTESAGYLGFYGNSENMDIEVIINKDIVTSKVFDNLRIVSNNVAPSYIEYNTDLDSTFHFPILRQEGNILTSDIEYREDIMKVVIPTAKDLQGIDKRMRDKYIKIKLRYNSNNLVKIHSLLTIFRYSYN